MPPTEGVVFENNVSRFKVNFLEDQEEKKDHSGAAGDTVTSHNHDSTQHKSQSTFTYKVFETLDFAPKTAFYRHVSSQGQSRPTMEEIRAGKSRLPKPETPKIKTENGGGIKLGWMQGVLMRCLLNIWGVMLFIRISWVVGNAGIGAAIGIIMLSALVTTLTSLSLAAICTNGEVKGGGAYYLISRSLGPEFGGAIGIIFSIANAIAVSMYIVGFAETLVDLLEVQAGFSITGNNMNDMRIWGLVTLLLLFGISMAGMAWESKAQFFLLLMLIVAMFNFVAGTFISDDWKEARGFVGYNLTVLKYNMMPHFQEGENFMTCFSVFFPAATGIMAGANISGDLKDPSHAIPKGTVMSIIISTITYIIFAIQSGSTTLLSATGNLTDMVLPGTLDDVTNCVFGGVQMNCTHGLLNSFQTMAMISGYGPIITAGIFAATLSSALASLVSAPKVFQAVCKDKLFPYIGGFGKGYGAAGEPYRAYALALLIAGAFVCVAELNAIAPIITNFFLISYTLINYSCFEASLSNSPGWRPSYKYYNTWTSLCGTILCATVMFITSWWTALITVVIIYVLYRYIQYSKPPVNWGSSKQALKYNNALSLVHELSGLSYHVKNFRPQFLVLTGSPSSRPRLVNFMQDISKGYGVMVCGQVVPTLYKNPSCYNENEWLVSNKVKAFHVPVSASSFRDGVRCLLQSNGIGVIKANTVILGFKQKWREQSNEMVEEYVHIIKDAFDHTYAVGLLRVREGLDLKNSPDDNLEGFGHMSKEASKVNLRDALSVDQLDNDVEVPVDTSSQYAESVHETPAVAINTGDVEMNMMENGEEDESPLAQYRGFDGGKPKGQSIDVYWLSDDGGLSILVPYLLTQSTYWKNASLRVFAAGHEGEIHSGRIRMATLLNKFRIEFGSVEIVVGLDQKPAQSSIDAYEEYRPKLEEEEEGEGLDAKTLQYIRIGELLRENSTDNTKLIVVTLPVPRDHTPALQYMSWLEAMTADLPPILLLRGNQQDALTFYC